LPHPVVKAVDWHVVVHWVCSGSDGCGDTGAEPG
jgi:hypothetical protein